MHAVDSGLNGGKLSSLDGSLYDPALDVKIRHQLPLLDGSPSLRKNRFFFQSQSSIGNNNQSIGIHHKQIPGGGTNLEVLHMYHAQMEQPLQLDNQGDNGSLKSVIEHKDPVPETEKPEMPKEDESNAKPANRKSRFHQWLDTVLSLKNKKESTDLEAYELGRKPGLREEAIDRENTLMNVLKSVKRRQSKEDLNDNTKSTFSFFGMRSKSKENVVDGKQVKKLLTVDKAIDQSRKYKPMENLADIPNKKRSSSLDKLKRIKSEMFGGKDKNEIEVKVEEGTVEASAEPADNNESAKEEDLNFDLQKEEKAEETEKKEDEDEVKVEDVNNESDEPAYSQVNKTYVQSPKTSPAQSSSGIGTASPRAMSPNQDFDLEGSMIDRSSIKSPTSTIDSRSGILSSKNRRSERRLSLTSNPKLNTIHEPNAGSNEQLNRSLSMQIDSDKLDGNDQGGKTSVGNRTYTNPIGSYYQGSNKVSKLSKSQDQLDSSFKRPAMSTSFMGDEIVTTISSSQNNLNRDHVTRISVTERRSSTSKEEPPEAAGNEDKKDEKKKLKQKSKKKSKKSKKDSKKKKGKKKKSKSSSSESASESDGSESESQDSDSESESASSDSESESDSSSSSDSDHKRSKSKRKTSKSRSKSRDRKKKRKSSRHRSESPTKKKKKSKKKKESKKEVKKDTKEATTEPKEPLEQDEQTVTATFEATNQYPQQHIIYHQRGAADKVYENVDILRLPPVNGDVHYVHPIAAASVPYDQKGEVAYYAASTLPSQRKNSGFDVIIPAQQSSTRYSSRATSEPRKKSGVVVAPNGIASTLDRYYIV